MKYLFILGRNAKLSLAELFAYFGKEIISIKENKNAVLINLKNPLKGNIDDLGGIISIGEVMCDIKEMESKMIYPGESNKLNYVVWDFSNRTGEVQEYLKKRFKEEKLKAIEKRFNGLIELQEGEPVPNLESKLINEEYFVFENYFGKIIQKCDYKEIEKRDMEKPFRREKLSISPRLAKIMVNLSEVKENETLVDSFCGIGVILQEALIQGIKVIGIDKDKDAIPGARKNLEWFGFKKSNYKLINSDSKRISISKADVLVSEPDLGPTIKKIPTNEKAKETLRNFESLMIDVLNNMKNQVKSKFVFTAPFIRIGKKRIGCDYERILRETGLKLAGGFPIPEFRENQIVGRHIFVLENQ